MNPKRRNRLIVATVIIVLAIGIVIVSVPYLPPPKPRTLSGPQSAQVSGGDSSAPGHLDLQIPGFGAGEKFSLHVNATEQASFCVLSDPQYQSWISTYGSTANYGLTFPWAECATQAGPTSTATLIFTATSSGTWDVIVLNSNAAMITVVFSPTS